MNSIGTICLKPCIPFPIQCPKTSFRKFTLTTILRSSLQDSQPPNSTQQEQQQQQQLNLSVLRFTLGIPGLDESYLPRWIGYGFGSLLLLNHFLGSDAAAVTPAQLSTEVLGLSLASFSIVLPYLGKFLKGAQPVDEKTIPDGTEQIFVMSTEIGNGLKEDLAWASYVLLRNTNAIAMLILIQGEICARGYWNIPADTSKEILLDWFKKKIEKAALYDLKDTLYFPQDAGSLSNLLTDWKRTPDLILKRTVMLPLVGWRIYMLQFYFVVELFPDFPLLPMTDLTKNISYWKF